MKKIIAVVLIAPFILSCGSGANKAVREEVSSQFVEATPFKTLPEETQGLIITGIGSSEKRANFELMREAAITSAQADLARKIQSGIEAVWKRTMGDLSEYKKEGFNEAESVEEISSLQKSIVDMELKGPWQIQEFVDKESGRYWVRILYSDSLVEKWTKERMQSENILKKYFIESRINEIKNELQKDIDSAKQREAQENSKISEILQKK